VQDVDARRELRARVQFAKNQNPIMGSGSPHDPTIAGCRYLVGRERIRRRRRAAHQADEWNEHLDRPSRDDEQESFRERYGNDPKAKLVTLNKGHKSTARSAYEAGASASKSGREAEFGHDK
jgi:hypothetical protein